MGLWRLDKHHEGRDQHACHCCEERGPHGFNLLTVISSGSTDLIDALGVIEILLHAGGTHAIGSDPRGCALLLSRRWPLDRDDLAISAILIGPAQLPVA